MQEARLRMSLGMCSLCTLSNIMCLKWKSGHGGWIYIDEEKWREKGSQRGKP